MPERERTERFTLCSDPGRMREARKWLVRILEEDGWAGDDLHDVAVAVSEACSNAHRYAYDGRTDGRIDLQLDLREDAIEIAVRDYGRGFDQEAYRTPDLSRPREGGYGIYLMQRLTDQLEHRTMETGTQVVMVKTRRTAEVKSADEENGVFAEEAGHVR